MSQIVDNIVQRECAEVREQTHRRSITNVALRMIAAGTYSAEVIAKISTLPLEEVEELIKKHSV